MVSRPLVIEWLTVGLFAAAALLLDSGSAVMDDAGRTRSEIPHRVVEFAPGESPDVHLRADETAPLYARAPITAPLECNVHSGGAILVSPGAASLNSDWIRVADIRSFHDKEHTVVCRTTVQTTYAVGDLDADSISESDASNKRNTALALWGVSVLALAGIPWVRRLQSKNRGRDTWATGVSHPSELFHPY